MNQHSTCDSRKRSFRSITPSLKLPGTAALFVFRWTRGTIKSRLYLVLLAALLPVFVTQIVMHYNHFQTHRNREFQADLEIARSVAETFDGFVKDVVRQTAAIGVAITLRQPSSLRTIDHILNSAKAEWSDNIDLCWIDSSGHVVACTDDSMTSPKAVKCPNFARILAGEDWFLGDLVGHPHIGQKRFPIGHAVHDETGGLIGMVAARIAPELLQEELSRDRSSECALTLFDRAGNAVYRHPRPASPPEAPRWLSDDFSRQMTKVLGGKEVTAIVRGVDGKERMIALTPVQSVGWVAGAERPKSLVMETVYRDFVRETCIFLLVVLCSVGFASIISSTIIHPIKELRNHATALGSGQPASVGKVSGPSELEDLSDAFEAMACEVSLREDALRKMHEKLEERVQERTAELSRTYDALKVEVGERIQAEEALRLSEARLRHVYENSPAMMCSVDEDGLICKVNGIIQRVLDFAKQTDSSMTNLDLNSLVKDTLQLWYARMENQGIKLTLSLEDHLPSILGDAIGIQQVVNNLVQNAMEAINEGGVGSLSISTQTGTFSFDRSRQVVVLKVQDSGTGIDEGDQNSIFNPFFTTKPTGTGLGLSISYKIIERHGGIIYYESNSAPFTTFIVELPVSA